jgi:quinol monooxygenase YgiN
VTMLHLAVSLHTKPGREDEARRLLDALVEPSRADDGCLGYDLHTDDDDSAHFFLYEAWRDVSAWERHMATEHLRRFSEASGDVVDRLKIYRLTRV